MVDLAMLSEVHFIIAAEAGVKAKVESTAAAINILISNLTWKGNQRIAGYRDTHSLSDTFPEEDIFVCCGAMRKAPPKRAPQRFCGSAMLPVAISASHSALPRCAA